MKKIAKECLWLVFGVLAATPCLFPFVLLFRAETNVPMVIYGAQAWLFVSAVFVNAGVGYLRMIIEEQKP